MVDVYDDPDYNPDNHVYPSDPWTIEFVAYERGDGARDVFAFEPPGSVPELDSARRDDYHIFIEWINSPGDIDRVAAEVSLRLGTPYEQVVLYRKKTLTAIDPRGG